RGDVMMHGIAPAQHGDEACREQPDAELALLALVEEHLPEAAEPEEHVAPDGVCRADESVRHPPADLARGPRPDDVVAPDVDVGHRDGADPDIVTPRAPLPHGLGVR